MPSLALPGSGQQAVCISLTYQEKHWILMPVSTAGIGKELKINGVALTQSGRELFSIVNVEPLNNYSKALARFLEGKGFRMIEVGGGEPRIVDVNAGTVFGAS